MLYFNTHVGATLIAKTVSVSRTSLHHFIDSLKLDPKALQP